MTTPCEWCGAAFEPHRFTPHQRQRFCSREHQARAYYYERQARQSEGAPTCHT